MSLAVVAVSLVWALVPAAHAEEAATVYTLSEWIEDQGGQEAVDRMMAEEAAAAARESFFENPQDSEEAAAAANQAMEDCGVQIGSFAPTIEGMEDKYSDADLAIALSMPVDDLFNFDFSNATVGVGSHGYGMSTNAVGLWNDPEAAAECVEKKVNELVDKVIEEKNKLEEGNYDSVKKMLATAVVKMAVDRAYELDNELGEALDALARLSSRDTCG